MKSHRLCRACSAPLREILLDLMQSTMLLPGADGLTLDDAVDCYPLGIDAGLVPSRDALVQMHPEMAEEIKTLFQDSPSFALQACSRIPRVESTSSGPAKKN